jgi:hypothetical protein
MKLKLGFVAVVYVCTGLFLPAAQPTNAPSRLDFSAFKIISDRNIFNTRRSPRYVPSTEPRVTRSRSRTADAFALVGTMRYEKGPYAFFDGTRSDYKKVLKPDDTIAGFKVTHIMPTSVKLESATNQIELRVGMQLRHEEEGGWITSERPESAEPSPGSSSSSSHLSLQPSRSENSSSNGEAQNGVSDGFPPPFNPDAVIQALDSGDLQQLQAIQTNAAPAAAVPTGSDDPVLQRLMQRRAQERGE